MPVSRAGQPGSWWCCWATWTAGLRPAARGTGWPCSRRWAACWRPLHPTWPRRSITWAARRPSRACTWPLGRQPAWPRSIWQLLERMVPVWRLARLGHQARSQAGLDPQQRLRRGWVQIIARDPAESVGLAPFRGLLAGVLGVDRLADRPEDDGPPVAWRLALDQERVVARRIPADRIEAALAGLSPAAAAQMVSDLRAGLSVGLDVGTETITLLPDEVRHRRCRLSPAGWPPKSRAIWWCCKSADRCPSVAWPSPTGPQAICRIVNLGVE